MKKTHFYGGIGILITISVVLAVGVFFIGRFNGLSTARIDVTEAIDVVDEAATDQRDLVEELLAETEAALGEEASYQNIDVKNYSFKENPDRFSVNDTRFQKTVTAFVGDIGQTDQAEEEKVQELIGSVNDASQTLLEAKKAYNTAVEEYKEKRKKRPQSVASMLGFTTYIIFTDLESEEGEFETETEKEEDADINSFN